MFGDMENVIEWLSNSQDADLKLNIITYNAVIGDCAMFGDMGKAVEYFLKRFPLFLEIDDPVPTDTERDLCRCIQGCWYLQEDNTFWCAFCDPRNCGIDGCPCPCAGYDPDTDSEIDSHGQTVTCHIYDVDALCVPCSLEDVWSPRCIWAHAHGSISHCFPTCFHRHELPKPPQPVVPRCDECGVRPGLFGCSSCPGIFCNACSGSCLECGFLFCIPNCMAAHPHDDNEE